MERNTEPENAIMYTTYHVASRGECSRQEFEDCAADGEVELYTTRKIHRHGPSQGHTAAVTTLAQYACASCCELAVAADKALMSDWSWPPRRKGLPLIARHNQDARIGS